MNLARLSYLQEFGTLEKSAEDDQRDDHFATARDLFTHEISHSGCTFNSDLGVDEESRLSTEGLMTQLGLRGKKALPFMNTKRSLRPYLVWTAGLPPSKVQQMIFNGKAPDYQPLLLRWHQLAGIASAVRMLSSPAQGGVLIADDTGIGKTSQTFGILAMMMHRAELAGMNAHKQVKQLEGLPCSAGPHIIVAPSSLIDNWRAEGMMWFNITVRFFVYEGSSEVRRQLLKPGSSFQQSDIKPYQKVILVSSSVSRTKLLTI
jgi:SNF2 family DNA or RNA helicase